jgi:hypothetical protein
MLEADLVASHAAVAHLIEVGDSEALYQSEQNKKIDEVEAMRISELLLETSRQVATKLRKSWRSEPDDEKARIGDFVCRLKNNNSPLWPHTRQLIAECLSSTQLGEIRRGYAEAVARCVDVRFFALGPIVPDGIGSFGHSTEKGKGLGDAHIHVGGAVSWDIQWCYITTRQYPLWTYRRAPTRLVKGSDFCTLLGKAVRLREKLARKYALEDRLYSPSFEILLYRRLRLSGNNALDDTYVRDYVLIRSLARREMLIGEVESLNEFTGEAWKRFWQKPREPRAGSKYWIAHLRRMDRLNRLQMKAAVQGLCRWSIGRAALRTNPEWPPARLGNQMRYAQQAIKGTSFKIILHAKRPDNKDDQRMQKRKLAKWEEQINKVVRIDNKWESILCGFDIAGPERDTPIEWFKDAVEAAKKGGRAITIHAGEDFYDPWQGLSRVHKVMAICDQDSSSPRIGHGSILGIDPYMFKWGQDFLCPVWGRREALLSAIELGNGKKAQLSLSLQDKLWEKLHKMSNSTNPELNKSNYENRFIQVKHNEYERKAFQTVQRWLTEELKDRGAIIESNPTSNLRVLGLPSYAWVPFWGLYASGLTVILGTDNPGIMETTLEDEYARLGTAFEQRCKLGSRGLPLTAHDWCERLVSISNDEGNRREKWRQIESQIRHQTFEMAIPIRKFWSRASVIQY